MLFSNMLDSYGVRAFTRETYGHKYVMPFVNEVSERIVPMHVSVINGNLALSDSMSDKDVFSHEDDSEIGLYLKECSKLTCSQVEDTEANPLITVLANAVRFYEGVQTFIKYINIGDDAVLACLVYGACEFEFYDGTSIPIQRCDSHELEDLKTVRITGKDIQGFVNYIDEESSYDMSMDCVNAVVVNIKQSSKNGMSKSYKMVRRKTYLFDERGLLEARSQAEKKRQRLELLKKQKEEERLRKEKELAELREARRREEIEKQYADASAGAEDFRMFIQGLMG